MITISIETARLLLECIQQANHPSGQGKLAIAQAQLELEQAIQSAQVVVMAESPNGVAA